MRLTPRRRALIAVLVSWPLGYLYLDLLVHLVFDLLRFLRDGSYVPCYGGLTQLVGHFNGCDTGGYEWGYAVSELLVFTSVAAAVGYGLARWTVWPVRDMAESVDQLGPTNLGLRMRQPGPRGDETRRLADAIDGMLERVSEGYEAQRRFAANASHELRTPLATQRALIEVSLSSDLTDEQLELLSRQLIATNERNEALVEGLLVLAETDRGLMSRRPQRLDLMVAAVVQSSRESARTDRGVEITAELDPVEVTGEQPLLERLVGNLVQNAVKYNVVDGWVRVQVRADGLLRVANSGPRVPPELVTSLFEPFRRVSGDRLDHGNGVGLGLTIARSIVAAHQGSIRAAANPDGGLTVDVRLPVG